MNKIIFFFFFSFRNDLNIIKLFVNRVLRYFPLLALAMLYAFSWLSNLISDTTYSYDGHKVSCAKMWLPTLLFYKNFYLSNDIKVSRIRMRHSIGWIKEILKNHFFIFDLLIFLILQFYY